MEDSASITFCARVFSVGMAAADDGDMTLEKLEERASKLRLKKIPLYCSDAHTALWAGRGANNMAYLGKDAKFAACAVHEPADLTEWLATRGLQTGEIPADGLCQYRAFSRALFGDEKHHKELQYLAVTFLRLHKARYLQSVTATELVERKAALQELVSKGAIVAVNYDGWCAALEYGLEWGQDYTLECVAWNSNPGRPSCVFRVLWSTCVCFPRATGRCACSCSRRRAW